MGNVDYRPLRGFDPSMAQHVGVEARLTEGGSTPLITRVKDRCAWRASPGSAFVSLILMDFGDFAMMRNAAARACAAVGVGR